LRQVFLGRLAESRGAGIVKHQVSIGEVNQHQIMLLAKATADLKKEKGAIAVVGL